MPIIIYETPTLGEITGNLGIFTTWVLVNCQKSGNLRQNIKSLTCYD